MIYLFDKDEQLIKLIKKPAIKSIEERQTLTDTRYISDRLSVELKALSDEVLARVEYVAVPTKANPHLFSLYFLATHENEGNTTMLEGAQVGIEELRKGIVEDKKPRNKTARPVIEELLTGTNWSARYVAETASLNTNLYYVSVFEALQKVCEVWDLEMQFFVEVSGNRIAARYIDFKRKIGKKVGTRLVYGTNALKLVQQVERTNLITAAIGRGKGEEVSSAEENESGQAGYGRKIDFSDIVWTKGANPVDKPKGQKYVEIKEATARYGIKRPDGMYPKVGIVEIETDDKNELLRRTYEELQKLSRPQATFKADVAYLKNAEIGDTIRVVRKDWQLDYETRIIEIAWDRLSDKATSITVGDQLNVSESKKTLQSLSALDDTISETVGQAQTKLLDHLISADGFNTNWYRPSEPPLNKTKIGDIWYKPDPEHEGEKIMLIWDGENWVEVVRTVGTKAITEKIEGLKAESARYEQEFMQGLQDATTQAEANAQAMRANLEAQIADETQAIKDKQAQFEAGMSQDRTKLVDLTQKVGTLSSQQTADKQSLSREIASAKSSVASVASDLATAKTSLNNAVAQANTKATSLEQSLSQARQTLEQQGRDLVTQASAQAELRTLTSEVKKLADGTQTTLSELSKTVSKATGDIASVTSRTKVVEDGLVGVNNRYTETTIKIHAQTGQITTLNAKTAQLESGLSGIKEKFENIKIGSRNYFSQYLANYDTSGTYAIRLVSETQPITITVTDNDTSVDVSGCYFGLFKDKFAKQGARWFLSNGTLNNAKKTISGWPILAVYPKNQATIDKIFNRYKVMVEIGNIATDWVPAEEDFRHELATYVRNAEEDSTELSRRIETADGKAVDAKAYAQQTADGFKSRIESLESYKDAEGTRAQAYFEAAKTETAKQITAERTAITNNYVAKSTYQEDAAGVTRRLTVTETTSNETKRNQANYEATTNRKIAELTQSTQTLDGKIASANTKVEQTATAIRTEISQVEGKIPTSVGGRNYVRGSKEMVIGSGRWSTGTFRKSGVGSISTVTVTDSPVAQVDKAIRITSSSVSDIVGIAQDGFEIAPNTYTVTYWIRGKIGQKIKLQTWWSNDDSTGISPVTALTQNGWQKLTFTARKQTAGVVSIGYVYLNNGAVGDYIDVLAPKLETGTVSTDYSQAPEDTAEIMSSLKTTITQTGEGLHQLSTKVTNQDGLITSHTADIKRLNNEVSSKVSQTSYDTLTGRVTSAESLIQQQANAINQRLTATQVESAITAKGYQTSSQVNSAITSKGYQTKADVDSNIAGRGFATATTLENKITETVSGYTREISRVEGLIPTETTGNILLASNVGVTNVHSSLLTLAEPIVKGKTYTVVQHWRKSGSTPSTGQPTYCIDSHMTDNGSAQYVALRYDSTIDSWTATFVSTVDVAKGTRIRFANTDYMRTPQGQGSWTFTTLVVGNIPLSSWQPHWSEQATVTALNAVKSTADEHTRTLTSLQNDTLKKAEVSITSDKIVLGVGKEINGRTFSTMIAQDSQNVAIIAKLMKVSSDMIVDGTITSKDLAAGSVTAAQILANAVTTEKLAANAVTADKLLADQALFNKLKANQAYLKTLFTTDAFAQTVKTIDLVADKITTGTLNGANVNVINLNASNITSGRLSANMISGGVLNSLNGKLAFDLNNAQLNIGTDNAAIRRYSSQSATQFIKFEDNGLTTVPGGGIKAAHTIIGSNYNGTEGTNSGFAGFEIFSGKSQSLSRIVGDRIEFRANQANRNTGDWVFDFRNNHDSYFYPQKGDSNHVNMFLGHMNSKISRVFANDYTIGSNSVSVLEYLRSLGLCIRHMLNGGFSDDALSSMRTERDKTLYKIGGGV